MLDSVGEIRTGLVTLAHEFGRWIRRCLDGAAARMAEPEGRRARNGDRDVCVERVVVSGGAMRRRLPNVGPADATQ